MFSRFSRLVSAFSKQQKTTANSLFSPLGRNPYLKFVGLGSLTGGLMYNHLWGSSFKQEENKTEQIAFGSSINPKLVENPKTVWEKIKSTLAHIIRLIHLFFIFTPSILTFPLRFFTMTEKIWLKIFVNSVQSAGVVWIKAFQYLSHRRDVIGPQMAEAFTHLRQNAPLHSFQQTKKNFKLSYNKEIHQIFEKFDQTPIASGSVSQVYKAIYKGKKVAVKVRHPEVDKYIQRDVNIMFGISKFLSIFSKSFEIPIGEGSLKKTLIDQIDFNIEKDNLIIFKKHFTNNKSVDFPEAFENETRDSILIESFVQGVPVTYFENNRHQLNAVIARLGASTFFEMLMKNNFIHADCHGGNILVQVTKQSTSFFGQIWEYLKGKISQFEGKLLQDLMDSQSLKNLYKASRQQESMISQIVRKCTQKVKLNLIDVGMVIRLDEADRINFVNFIKSIIEGNSQKCASMICSLSNFDGKKIIEGNFGTYKNELKNLFSILQSKSIFDIEGMQLLIGMLNIIRDNNMKLDGQFATLLTNMVVLESIAKQIDPSIQILKCAVPYFKFVDNPIAKIDHQRMISSKMNGILV